MRGRAPVDLDALAALLVRFGQLVIEQPRIREIDINPLLASAEGFVALDARVVLYDAKVAAGELPRPAIRPYPTEYVSRVVLADAAAIALRPIRPEDEPAMIAFHGTLSDKSVRMRYMQGIKLDVRTAHERLVRVCFGDYDREMAVVAELESADGERPIVAVGRLSRNRVIAPDGAEDAEFSLLVGDPWQGRGVGRVVLSKLIEVGRREGLSRIYADILAGNLRMQRLCSKLGFTFDTPAEGGVVRADRKL